MSGLQRKDAPGELDPGEDSAGGIAAAMQPQKRQDAICEGRDERYEKGGVGGQVKDLIGPDRHVVEAEPYSNGPATTYIIGLGATGVSGGLRQRSRRVG